jgi:hypothetical protein
MEKYYFEIDHKKNQIISSPERLPRNWKNISGLSSLNDEQLYDLSWANNPGVGFVELKRENISKIILLSLPEEIFNATKTLYKTEYKKNRQRKENGTIKINNAITADLTENFRTSILSLYVEAISNSNLTVNWKFNEGFMTLNSQNIINLQNSVRKYTQDLFDSERIFYQRVDECLTIRNILEIDNIESEEILNFNI